MSSLRKKGPQGIYHWRGVVPIRQADGSVTHEERERSTRTSSHARARAEAKRIEAEFHERAGRPVEAVDEYTFGNAATAYMNSGGEPRYLEDILAEIEDKPLSEVDQVCIQELADKIKPGRAVSTVNRHVFTPVLSVLNYAARIKMCPPPTMIRPKGHDKAPPVEWPDLEWFQAVLPVLNPRMRALVLILTCHGLRVSEAIERTPADVDARRWTLSIPDTKTGEPVNLPLANPVIEAIKAIPGWREQAWLFGTPHRSNVSRNLKAACKRAGVRHYRTHALGRHCFAAHILLDGKKSLKFLMNAGRWKTPAMPMRRYGHLEQSEVDNEVRNLADDWHSQIGKSKVVRLKSA